MVDVISVHAYQFLAFSDLTCHLGDTGIGIFCLYCAVNSKKTKLGGSNQEASPLAGKNNGIVLVPCSHMEMNP